MLFPRLKNNGLAGYLIDILLLISDQLRSNNFEINLSEPIDEDPRNLFALRTNLQLLQFDQANFVIVAKCGQFVVHFVRRVYETANQYHNVKFDHRHVLLNKLLYARFAWALCKIVNDLHLSGFDFDEQGTSGDSGKKTVISQRKRKRPDKADPSVDSSCANTSTREIPKGVQPVHGPVCSDIDAGRLPMEELYGNKIFSDQGIKSTNSHLLLSYQFYSKPTISR